MAAQRVSPPRVFPEATRAPRPPATAAGSADAHRQTSFTLGDEADLVVRGLSFEGEAAAGSAGARYRTQPLAAALGLWSRAWLCRLEALHAVEWGNYAAAVPLVRAAADHQAAEVALLRTDAAEWLEWLGQGGIGLAPGDHAAEFRLHAFRSGEVLAGHETLGPIYRAATDLSLSHFGATLLLAASDSDAERVVMTFGDRDFHLGLAELCLGWLHLLAVAQVDALEAHADVFAPTGTPIRAHAAAARIAAARTDRCRIEAVDRAEGQRYLVHNWRRTPGAAAKRILL